MHLDFKLWSWKDWTMLTIRMIWVIMVITFMYQSEPQFTYWLVMPALVICHITPFLFIKKSYTTYLLSELVFAGGIALLLSYSFGLTRLFPPALATIAFYTTGKLHRIALPLSITIFVLTCGISVQSALAPDLLWRSITDALGFYIIFYGLQKGSEAIHKIEVKLALIGEQYSILKQYSAQIEKTILLEERYRMARELHDTIGHNYTSLILGIETLRPYLTTSKGTEKLEQVLGYARAGLDDIRKHVHAMDPLDEELPLDQALIMLLDEFKAHTGVNSVFRTIGQPFPVLKHTKLTLYRCLQESLTNATKHGEASRVQVVLQYEPAQLRLQIQDNGCGKENLQFGFGLQGMLERLHALQGQLYVDSHVEEGTIVTVTLPNQIVQHEAQIKILLVDDLPLVTESLRLLLGEEQDFHITVAESGEQAIEFCKGDLPDIILMDIHMPNMDGICAAEKIKQAWPKVRIVMMTTLEDTSYAARALKIGAEGYLLKSTHPKELAATIRLIYSGGTMISQAIAQDLFQHEVDWHTETALKTYGLTERENDILHCLMDGLRNKQIAQKLFLSEGTIRNYISSIYLKLQVSNREEAVTKIHKENSME